MAFWKPGTIAPGTSLDRETEKETNEALVTFVDRGTSLSIQQQRKRLPIYKSRDQILYLIENYQTTIIVGHTGCGKTTQIPQYLNEAGWTANGYVVACTQPRRVAATTVADRVATEMNVKLGEEVGYSIRVIMIDEAHERSLYTDVLLGILKKILKKRPELRIIVSSATLDAEAFYEYFNTNATNDSEKDNASIISLEGKMFPVDIHYSKTPCSDYVETSIQTVFDIHVQQPFGDILVFLTGRDEIDFAVGEISERATTLPRSAMKILPLPIYAGLQLEQQLQIFEPTPYNTRKVIVATNIAEASITLEGIVYVIDCGFVKLRAHNPKTGMESLVVTPISKASAQQRAGRAGRVGTGKTYRLYTEDSFYKLNDASIPEIQRSNLAQVVLHLKALGIDNVLRFDFLTPPPAELMIRSLELLYSLKALDDHGRLTMPLGMQLAEFPVDPMLGKILLDSYKFQCGEEMLSIAAMLSVQDVFIIPSNSEIDVDEEKRKFTVEEGDHITLLNVFNAFITRGKKSARWCHEHCLNFRTLSRALSIHQHLKKYLDRFEVPIESCGNDTVKIRKCLISGYFSQAAKMMPDGSFRTVRDNVILYVHPSSVLFTRNASWVIFHEVVETTKAFMRDLTVIDPAWLAELALSIVTFFYLF
ncbi:P-loop containing nucleoside triphosphate hydrolase protein [Gigaspora margarita]|uniref:P-loop containing nucleoside triphosphate hydrolase protein n=1 Tax=Gigaspora margarita TaxID=4874 RepID=A0A8H4A661_GIGMA|nr:P-loop containing nucleoside triphosphate hydrolase protein [Gigaspora margarita]